LQRFQLLQLDTDEYLIPAGNWTNIRSWLRQSVSTGQIEKDTHILSFFQTRAIPNHEFMESYIDDKDCKRAGSSGSSTCLLKRPNTTFLQAYDCERNPLPKPGWAWRAKKQIYRPDFVWNHFIHYSTVTKRLRDFPNEDSPPFIQRRPFERRVDEISEGFMLHTKTTHSSATKGWERTCRGTSDEDRKKCPIGFAYLQDEKGRTRGDAPLTQDGFARNCYKHSRIQDKLVTEVEGLLQKFRPTT
jgi:hypothetical protein